MEYKGCTCGADKGQCVDCMQDFIDSIAEKPPTLPSPVERLVICGLDKFFTEICDVDPEDIGSDGMFIVDGKWYAPTFGCDSLQMFIDELRSI